MVEHLIPAPTVALETGMSREQVIRRILKGEIAGQSLGGRYFVERQSLEAYLARVAERHVAMLEAKRAAS